jgi:hypothetical protein
MTVAALTGADKYPCSLDTIPSGGALRYDAPALGIRPRQEAHAPRDAGRLVSTLLRGLINPERISYSVFQTLSTA